MPAKKNVPASETPAKVKPATSTDQTLPSADPKFPPIQSRYLALHEAGDKVIPWAQGLGAKPKDREEAILVILRSEYGPKAVETWAKKE